MKPRSCHHHPLLYVVLVACTWHFHSEVFVELPVPGRGCPKTRRFLLQSARRSTRPVLNALKGPDATVGREDEARPSWLLDRRRTFFHLSAALLAVSSFFSLAQRPAAAAAAQPLQPQPLAIRGSTKLMPAVGYGTCCRATSRGPPLIESTLAYLANGGRLIDTAQLYTNHRDLAVAIRESGIPRDQLWVTSKLQVKALNAETDVIKAVDVCLEELNLDYVDLMLLHGGDGWGIGYARDESLWRGLISAKRAGKVRSIGVSNHNRQEIERLAASTGELPAVNQLEFHPWVPPETKELVRWCQGKGIAVTAYGSLGGSANKAEGDVAAQLAKKYGVSSAQVLLRWAVDQGVAVIPGATTEAHIREDLELLGFQLDARDAKLLEAASAPEDFTRWHNCRSGCAA